MATTMTDGSRRLLSGDYELQVHYRDDEDRDETICELLRECEHQADMRHCFTEGDAHEVGGERSW